MKAARNDAQRYYHLPRSRLNFGGRHVCIGSSSLSRIACRIRDRHAEDGCTFLLRRPVRLASVRDLRPRSEPRLLLICRLLITCGCNAKLATFARASRRHRLDAKRPDATRSASRSPKVPNLLVRETTAHRVATQRCGLIMPESICLLLRSLPTPGP